MGKEKTGFYQAVSVCIAVVLFWCGGAVAETDTGLSSGQTVYVPIYSHIYCGNKEQPFDLAATLSLRNTDTKSPITILSVKYYDSNGTFIRSYTDHPVRLPALASMRFVVKESDKTGGSGASFIVVWKSDAKVNSPVIESVMIGTKNQQGISFTSRGQPIHVSE